MSDYLFSAVPDVLVGPEASKQLGDLAVSMGITRALIVTDRGIIQFGLLDSATNSLNASKVEYELYADVVADPPESVVMDAVTEGQAFNCDGVIGFGGGSSMDVAKLLAVLIKGEQSLSDIYGVD